MRAILRDAASGTWRLFERPRELVVAREIGEVVPALKTIEAACARGAYAVGFIAYEAAPAFDPALLTKKDDGFPPLWFGIYDSFHTLPPETIEGAGGLAEPAGTWNASISEDDYAHAFDRLQEYIRDGLTYQVNFTYRLTSQTAPGPWALFQRLVAAQEPAYGAYLHAGEWVVCSASPELFFEKTGSTVRSRPMKGTAPRGLWYEQDVERARGLKASEKDRAENVMIVDMVRNDLGRIARPGSVNVSALLDVERYPTVWQMTSTVTAETEASLTEVIAALFPPASITGAPKPSTMAIIADLEGSPRRVYTGTIGFVDPDGRAQFNVAIRTALLNRKTGTAEYGVGGGIVADSRPGQELAEARLKSRVLDTARPRFDLLETLIWKPGEGCVLLDRHVARLAQSAEYFGFRVDLDEVRRRLENLSPGDTPHRIRMLVSRSGAIDLTATPCTGNEKFFDVAFAVDPIDASDPFLYHKTTHRRVYDAALASRPGAPDVLLYNQKGDVTESTIATLIVRMDDGLFTPPVESGLLPGTARAQLLAEGRVRERTMSVGDVRGAQELYLVNSVRGMHRVSLTDPS